ncbi:hypothetical protein AX16_000370 [Volvariella volvacea WC 439]|nr:hypothetical protein AX16_000370 [Volvariella volvacea WC 439]
MPDATLIFPPNPQTATSDSHLHIDAIQSEDAQISGQTALPVPAPPPIHPARGRTIASSVERLSPPAASSTKRKRVPNDERSVGGPIKRSVKRDQKSPSTAPRSRSSRGPSVSPFDPSADPGEELDPTVTTMAAICSDTGQGRISSKAAEVVNNHAAWKAANREKRARMRDLMERKKYGRSEEDDDDPSRMPVPPPVSPGGIANSLSDSTQGGNAEPDAFDYSQDLATSRYNVQIRIGPNGETVIDEDSLVVDRTEPVNLEEYTHVVESDHTKFVNSGTYGKRYRGARWSAEETERFYEALSQYGENYELIAYVLPGRDRKSCKNKFKAEDKKNHARIEYCLRNTIPMDVRTLSRMTGKDFSGPVPEIRLPPQLPTSTPQPKEPLEEAIRPLSKTRKYSMSTEPELILGNIDDFDS